ncbi:MAG: L,D-transpeptidase family protein [Hyphomicrobium sp.]|nr:L,D-transpeptidase family protein [Hyphomicrobium sp.]
MVIALLAHQPAFAVDPDDQPWDEIDRVLKENPSTTAATDATPAANPAGDTAANPAAAAAYVPGGPDLDPEPGIENDRLQGDPAADPNAGLPAGHMAPTQGQAPAPSTTPTTAPTVSPAATPATNPAPQTATPQTPPPATPPVIAAPAAVPSEPVANATVAVDGLLYLPTRRYFDTKAVVTLKDYNQDDRAALVQFYDARMGQALWVTHDGPNAAARSLIAEIEKADDWGLAAKDYRMPSLARIGAGAFSEDELVDAEIKLSLTAMLYTRDARGGRIQKPSEQLSSYLDRQPQLIEPVKVMEALAAAPDKAAYLRGLHPKHVQFERLRQKLLAQRANAEDEVFEKIPKGPKISAGKSHWQVALIRKRLNVPAPGMKPDGTAADENYYDPALAQAVVRFREKHELEPYTPTITNELRTQLNVDDKVSEDVLLANMEQWRWMPDDLGATHIMVNIPEFMVRVVKDDAVIHSERVVTGQYDSQTPIFSDRMQTVVFKPSWIVPHSIMVNELLPRLRAGGNPIAGRGLEIERNGRSIDPWDVNWNRSDIRNYHVFQPPGPGNVLGVVKFLFPNKHAVYLHDTPSKSLFNERTRMFSHGCVRVRNPVRLAEVIMSIDKGWDSRVIKDLVTRGPGDNDVALDAPLPVHLTYFTASVEDDGTIKRFEDVYGHEKRITLALQGRWTQIVKNRDHLLPPDIKAIPVARNRDNWGDADGWSERRSRQQGATYRAVTPPGYKKSKQTQTVGDIFQQVFGGF